MRRVDAYARQTLLDDTTGGFPELSVLLQQKEILQ